MLARETRIAINGFGRVGRCLMRCLANHPTLKVVHVNDPMPAKQAAYLLRFDSVMGRWFGEVKAGADSPGGGELSVLGSRIGMSHTTDVSTLDWRALGVDFVINSSGTNNTRAAVDAMLSRGASRVFISAPAPEAADVHILMGVNNMALKPAHRVISGGSCTAHCFAPVVKALSANYGIQRGFMHTVHSFTSSQNLMDGAHAGDPRRGRAAASNIVPTTTEAIKAFEAALPEYKGLLKGMATRVPVDDGSNVDLTLLLDRPVSREEINEYMKLAIEGGLSKIVEYSDDPLVSSDIVGNPHSCVFDSLLTEAHGPMVRLLLWYDNEWGYANRFVELLELASYVR